MVTVSYFESEKKSSYETTSRPASDLTFLSHYKNMTEKIDIVVLLLQGGLFNDIMKVER